MIGDLARSHIRFVDDSAYATPVVAMCVRIDHCRDGKAPADMLLEQLPRRANHFRGHQRVKDDPAGLAPDRLLARADQFESAVPSAFDSKVDSLAPAAVTETPGERNGERSHRALVGRC